MCIDILINPRKIDKVLRTRFPSKRLSSCSMGVADHELGACIYGVTNLPRNESYIFPRTAYVLLNSEEDVSDLICQTIIHETLHSILPQLTQGLHNILPKLLPKEEMLKDMCRKKMRNMNSIEKTRLFL